MAKKKKGPQGDATATTNGSGNAASVPPTPANPSPAPPSRKSKTPEPSTSALIICRNKHWRYISSFHGPWLQLPPEVLESLAHSNYLSPRPHPIDPAVFYDLVKIRKAVDEATTLAVRATSGLTSSALSNSLNAGNGMLGGAAALGIGYGGGGGNAKLSRERKHRMRELATQKLSQAYHLDEIAASVATMQSASTLEDVAHLVLQRNSTDVDAKYVHFFHEKIPSRMMAQCTPLDVLNEIIAERPSDGSPLRTRALTRIFKEDYAASARDLTEGLQICRYMLAQHREGKDQLVSAHTMKEQYGRDWRSEVKVEEEDQPNSLETQLLFHRAGVYFTIACQHVDAALDGLKEAEHAKQKTNGSVNTEREEPPALSPAEKEAHGRRLEARKMVKTNAKRALRDYIAFLSHFDYTPGLPSEIAEDFLRRVGSAANGHNGYSKKPGKGAGTPRLLDSPSSPSSPISDALVPHRKPITNNSDRSSWPQLPPPEIYQASQLFSSSPPASLPPYPSPTSTFNPSPSAASAAATAFADSHEAITYHPLLTDALHSLLLCHALLQTPPTELRRHAHNAARLARVCDGYPIFLAARSPARADWIEVLRRSANWIQLQQSWESLCRPAPLPGHGNAGGLELAKGNVGAQTPAETEAQRRERQKHEAILEALADERVVDEESFQRSVRARERRNQEDEEVQEKRERAANASPASHMSASTSATNGTASTPAPSSPAPAPKRWAQEDGREYPISTERAEAISRWVREAPLVVEGAGGRKGKGKRGGTGAKGKKAVLMEEDSVGLEGSVSALSVEDVGEDVE
ncbi:hypothetical protein K432DRAFT_404969 [Lepidopterella palustris CBS 459.81]|uniref:Histidine kinase group protein n=1 Tax=Lepidopterella palustris CBS 459.81 TaxID=1314670 RepID=A0A8E2JEY9_9PEZI|nr:hypothetical protein K432DRAFT_404969 [Lepidopterella palustris CBS 459.81]